MNNDSIHLSHVTRHYGPLTAVNDVTLHLNPGQIVGLVGPNGSGKSTLMQTMVGQHPYTGRINIFGLDPWKNRTSVLEKTCFFPDYGVLPSHLRLHQVVDLFQKVYSHFNAQHAIKILKNQNLDLGKKIKHASKGQKVLVHLACLMALDMPLMILDEPTLGLDPLVREQFYSQLLKDYFDSNKIILISNHHLEELEHLLTDVVLMKDGQVIFQERMSNIHGQYLILRAPAKPEWQSKINTIHPIYVFHGIDYDRYLFKINQVNPHDLQELGQIQIPTLNEVFKSMILGESL